MSALDKIDPQEMVDIINSASFDKDLGAKIETSKGPINIVLHAKLCPKTVENFRTLAAKGYYDGLIFHRVIPEFMVQGGCPVGRGNGSPGYVFEDECHPDLRHDDRGILSMANAGPGTNGSQFFITHVPTPWLDGKHTVFGQVVAESDQTVVDSIEMGDTITSIEIHELE